METKKITDRISFIPEIREPLSAEVFLIQGDEYLYIFDVGFNDSVTEYLNSLKVKKKVIASHFHRDHIGNFEKTDYDEIFIGNFTKKYVPEGTVVTKPVKIHDGIDITIYPIPSSHAKGSLCMVCDGIVLLGDSAYASEQEGKVCYNVTLLKDQIDFLESLNATKAVNSHEGGKVRRIEVVKRMLSVHYARREQGNPLVEVR